MSSVRRQHVTSFEICQDVTYSGGDHIEDVTLPKGRQVSRRIEVTKTSPHLEDVMMCTESPPKDESATKRGIIHAAQPSIWLANVCNNELELALKYMHLQ